MSESDDDFGNDKSLAPQDRIRVAVLAERQAIVNDVNRTRESMRSPLGDGTYIPSSVEDVCDRVIKAILARRDA